MPSKSQKWLPEAPAIGSGLMSACADHEWKTCARSSRATSAPRSASTWISGSGKVLIVRAFRVVAGQPSSGGAGPGAAVAGRRDGGRGRADAGARHPASAQPGSVKIVRCHGLCGHGGVVVHDVLDVGVLVEGVGRHVLAEAAVPVTAVRHLADDRDVVVDPHAAGPDLAGGAAGAVGVAGPGGGGEAERRVVGQADRLVVVVERDDREHRPEHLVAPDLGVERHVGDEGRLVVAATGELAVGCAAAGDDLGVVAGALDHVGDLGLVRGRRQRAEVGGLVAGRAEADGRHEVGDAAARSRRGASGARSRGWRRCSPGRC